MSTGSRMAGIVAGMGSMFAVYFTILNMGMFDAFAARIGYTTVAQLVFMSLVVITAVAITYETLFSLKSPKDLLQNLQSGLAQATGASEAEVGRFMEGAASQLMAKSPVKLPAKVMQVTVGDMQFPSTADLITRLRSNFGAIPRDLPLGKVLQVTSSAPSDMITGIIPPQSASSSDGISVSEYTKQRNRRTLYFTLAVVIGCVVLYVLSLFFGGGG